MPWVLLPEIRVILFTQSHYKCITESEKIMLLIKLSCALQQQGQISGHFYIQTKISTLKFQDNWHLCIRHMNAQHLQTVTILGLAFSNSEIRECNPCCPLLIDAWSLEMFSYHYISFPINRRCSTPSNKIFQLLHDITKYAR